VKSLRSIEYRGRILLLSVWVGIVPWLLNASSWQRLDNCHLVPHPSNDGDSFRIRLEDGRELQFRLYFVDTPEDGLFYPERVEDQGRYFGLNVKQTVEIGEIASRFTKAFLGNGNLTVWTEWKDAWGMQKRYAALIYKGNESLIEALVQAGLVRIHGFSIDSAWPGGCSSSAYQKNLHAIETEAKRNGRGAWGKDLKNTDLILHEIGSDKLKSTRSQDHDFGSKVDINLASLEQLESLPGVGPVLAARIQNRRPFYEITELKQVKGIGEKLFRNIEDNICIGGDHYPEKTAAYYLQDPLEWSGREIELSILSLELELQQGPDGFQRLKAVTSLDAVPGGSIPLYIQNEWVEEALNYFKHSHSELKLRVRFFCHKGEWITVYRK